MAYPNKVPLADKYYTSRHADVTVAAASAYVGINGQGEVKRVIVVLEGAITGADETLTLYKNGSATSYTCTVTQSGSAAGDIDVIEVTPGGVTVEDGDYLTLVSSNASGGTTAAMVTYVVREL